MNLIVFFKISDPRFLLILGSERDQLGAAMKTFGAKLFETLKFSSNVSSFIGTIERDFSSEDDLNQCHHRIE